MKIQSGIELRATKKKINISVDFKRKDDKLICIIEDNGIGINESLKNKVKNDLMHHSVGIENILNRIRLLNEKYNLKSSVRIEDKNGLPGYTGTGTVVTLQIPLEIKEE
ncbi:MAG: hypothetical protein SGI83_17170 [Bacteroidota bacterium]|nr:hypothetical protein [Bacteroidota bacterium]